jgi:hypothetical protein
MRRLTLLALAFAAAAVLQPAARADGRAATAPGGGSSPSTSPPFERHHYTMSARVRPLAVFWIRRAGIGDAIVTRRRAPGEASYSLLIGSDPERTPFRINRWGYIEEEIRGAQFRMTGLMTQSDEESIAEAEANVRRRPIGGSPYRVIDATADGQQSRSRVTSIAAPETYTFRQLPAMLDLVRRADADGVSRAVRLAPGVRPGFLAALADAMQSPSTKSIVYVYYGRLYELRRTRTERVGDVRIDGTSYGDAVAADFLVTSRYDGEQTRFSMTYATDGPLAEVPLRITYQPRWWIQIELTLDDGNRSVASSEGVVP